MQCSRCRSEAVISQQYSGLHLCRDHFIADVEAKAKRAIRTHGWLSRGDRIAVVLRGRAQDCALLRFLAGLVGRRRDISLMAMIAPGLSESGSAGSSGQAFAKSLGVQLITSAFGREYRVSFDAAVRAAREAGIDAGTLCHAFCHQAARREGITRLALSTSLDDRAGSVLVQVLMGTPCNLLRLAGDVEGGVTDILPFLYVPRHEVALYSHLAAGQRGPAPKPRHRDGFSADAMRFLDTYSQRHPSTPYSLVSFGEQLASAGMPEQEGVRLCGQCGEPYLGTCRTCTILSELKSHGRRILR